jgi:hypothetical protein
LQAQSAKQTIQYVIAYPNEFVHEKEDNEEISSPPFPEELKEAELEPITLKSLNSGTIEANRDILDDKFKVVGKLVKGKADKLHQAMATYDDELVLPEKREGAMPPPSPAEATAPCEEPWLKDVVLMAPSLEPNVEHSSVCPLSCSAYT